MTSIGRAALLGLCPHCGKGKLYNGLLKIAPRCTVCGLDYAIFDAGDGPAVFVVLIAGGLVTAAALWVEFTFSPPIWVHGLLWIPLTTLLILVMLRWTKSLLLVLQYRHKAGEGRLTK
ncbi:MAG: DUF983 domain-containing protein [Rhizomicrobium sp.]|nr:DUF983 domain-containing protein [Rhizomicrobium sp.]